MDLFSLSGTVIEGKKRGKKMGFPTVNFPVDPKNPKGTYISRTALDGELYPSITFIGTVDTFEEDDFLCETYILHFDKDIYGKEITVHIMQKIRDNKKFESEETLIEQIKNDKKIAEKYFNSLK